jgi:hypothetical protein
MYVSCNRFSCPEAEVHPGWEGAYVLYLESHPGIPESIIQASVSNMWPADLSEH